jgi:hypothetical protein
MASDAVKIARIQADANLAAELIRNPVIELLAGVIVISYLNRGSQSWYETLTGIDVAAVAEGAGLITLIGLQQLGPDGLKAVLGASAAGLGVVAKAIPLLGGG